MRFISDLSQKRLTLLQSETTQDFARHSESNMRLARNDNVLNAVSFRRPKGGEILRTTFKISKSFRMLKLITLTGIPSK